MRLFVCFILFTFGLSLLIGCTSTLSPDVYSTENAGQVQRVIKGVVVGRRFVTVSDTSTDIGVGSVAGGALGAIAGSEIGQGRGSLAAGIGGALLGGIVGNQAQKRLTSQTGIEYVVKLHTKSLISIVQGPVPAFSRGQHVLVQYGVGGRSRVIDDPDYAG